MPSASDTVGFIAHRHAMLGAMVVVAADSVIRLPNEVSDKGVRQILREERAKEAERVASRERRYAERLRIKSERERPIIEAAEAKRARKAAQRLKARNVKGEVDG